MSFNKVILIGRLTADPQLKQTQNAIKVTSFAIAVDRGYKDNQNNNVTDFINIVAWKHTAEFITKYFTKGRQILVEGKLQSRTWTDASGERKYTVEVTADNVSFVDSKNTGNTYSPAPTGPYSAPSDTDATREQLTANDDDLPF